jgi:hypothetical protein
MMSASGFVGRVGGLAVFFGVGVALATGCGVAAADAGSSDSSSSSPGKSATSNPAHSASASKSSSTTKQASKASVSSPAATAMRAEALSTPDLDSIDGQKSSAAAGIRNSRATAVLRSLSPAALTPAENSNTGATRGAGVTPGPIAAALSAVATAPSPVSTESVASPLTTTPTLQSMPSLTAATKTVTRLIPVTAVPLAISVVFDIAIATVVNIATFAAPSPTTATPTLVLNGYNVVPSSTETVTSLYGTWAYTPGNPALIQGQQKFDVVDPKTSLSVGSFDALVSRGNGYPYTQLVVTATDPLADVGTDPGQVPPVGSVISNFKLAGFGLSYSAMPSLSGDVVKVKLLTPLGDIPLPISFDAALGTADHTVDNRPVELANGYYIAPADPDGENLTGATGFLPLYGTVQGNQKFNVYDSNHNVVGSFDGEFTTTADIAGDYTQAILVTHTYGDGSNVGTGPGDVPPVGSVYNVTYWGTDDDYLLYSSLPSSSGDVVSLIAVKPNRITNSILTLLDASTPPFTPTLSAPGGKTFVPVDGTFKPSGVNGLPPREVEIQGYEQFDVYQGDTQQGIVDASVYRQWDLLNIQSEALLITGSTGTGDLPPVGSVFNFVYFGKTGLGVAQSVVPSTSGDVISLKVLTPFFDIPLYSFRRPVNDRIDVDFYDPFVGP